MDIEMIKEMAESVNNVVLATAKPYQEQIRLLRAENERYKKAIALLYERFEEKKRGHSFHKHHHYGCIFCQIEQALKG